MSRALCDHCKEVSEIHFYNSFYYANFVQLKVVKLHLIELFQNQMKVARFLIVPLNIRSSILHKQTKKKNTSEMLPKLKLQQNT